MKNYKSFLIEYNTDTQKAISKINKFGGSSLIVVKKNILEGIISSRDLRNAIINKNILNKTINKIYNKKPRFIYSDQINEKLKYLIKFVSSYRMIPVVERKTKKIIDIINFKKLKKLQNKKIKKINASIVIMAGGKGKRLLPYTSVLPKPLLPIKDKPIIKHIIDKFKKHGENKLFVTVNYKSSLLTSYLKSLNYKSNKIKIINEKKPLGTIGGLYHMKNYLMDNFFLTNCDTIVNANYNEILNFHLKENNDVTIIVTKKVFIIPYGVCKKINQEINFIEKPNYKFYVNTGFYVINKKSLNFIKKNKYLDFNNFLDTLIKNKKKINYFIIPNKDWIDFGQKESFHSNRNKKF